MTTAKITDWNINVLLRESDRQHIENLESITDKEAANKRPNFTKKEKTLLSQLQVLNKPLNFPLESRQKADSQTTIPTSGNSLDFNSVIALFNKLQSDRDSENKLHIHEILERAELILPQNEVIPRNPVLEERCRKLRLEQENVEYANMTKNVDAIRKTLPEDTISYQIKSINKQLIAILQFVFSVMTGFAFGFLGLELIFGGMEFGFRLLLGIICALVIALAEIYFLAKKLNEYDEFVDSPTHGYVTASKKND